MPGHIEVPSGQADPEHQYYGLPPPKTLDSMLDDIDLPDDATRPTGPRFEDLTPVQRMPGRHLAMIHDHFRGNMQVLRELLCKAESGELTAGELMAEAEAMPMMENYRRFGALCGQHCQIIEMHHSIEDQAIFPELSGKSAALKSVVDRLIAEHEVVHALLVKLVGELSALIENPSPAQFANAREVYEVLEKLLLSHFGYEETEIGDALGYYGIGV
jgi:hypothetical protein